MSANALGYNNCKDIVPSGNPWIADPVGFQLVKGMTVFGIADTQKSRIYKLENISYCFEIEGLFICEDENYLISFSNSLKKIFVWDGITGKKKSEYQTDKFLLASVLVKGKILSYTRKKQLCYFNYINEEHEWCIDEKERVDSLRVNNNFLFYTNRKNTIYCRSLNSNEITWFFDVSLIGKHIDTGDEKPGRVGGEIYLYEDFLIAYVVSSKIIAINQKSGEMEWAISLDSHFASCSMSPDGYLYCLEIFKTDSIRVNLYEIDVLNGSVLRKKDFSPDIENLIGGSLQYMDYSSISITEKGLFFSLLEDRLLLKVDRQSFDIDWHYKHHCSISARQILISSNHLLYIDQEHQVFAFKSEGLLI
jgi:hypothetical protein